MAAIMQGISKSPQLANAIFGAKQGGRIYAALGDPAFFGKILGELHNESGGFAKNVSDARMAGFDGAVSKFEGAVANLETAIGRAFDDGGKGGFLTDLTLKAGALAQHFAEMDPAAQRASVELGAVAVAGATLKSFDFLEGGFGLQDSAMQLGTSAGLLKEAAIALGAKGPSGAPIGPTGGGLPEQVAKPSGPESIIGKGGFKGVASGLAEGVMSALIYAAGADAIHAFENKVLGWTPEDRKRIDGIDPWKDDWFGRTTDNTTGPDPYRSGERAAIDERARRAADDFRRDPEAARGRALMGQNSEASAAALEKVGDKATLVHTSFDTLTTGSSATSSAVTLLGGAAAQASEKLLSLASFGGEGGDSGGDGGGTGGGSGSGLIRASYGGGGGADDGSPVIGGAGTVATGLPTEARAFLDTISSGEAHGYNVLNGGGTFGDLSHHPGGRAAGRYQDLPSTWRRISGALGLHDFSPTSQDKGNWWLAQQDYRAHTGRDLLSDLKTHDPARVAAIGRSLHSTWVSTNGSFARKFNHFMGAQHSGEEHPALAAPPLKRRSPAEHDNPSGHAVTAKLDRVTEKLERVASAVERGGLVRHELSLPKGMTATKTYQRGSVGSTVG